MRDLNTDQFKVHFSKNAIFQMEFTLIELKFYMQAFFDADFHLDWPIRLWLLALVAHNELFFFCYSIIVSVYYYINEISQPNHNSVV